MLGWPWLGVGVGGWRNAHGSFVYIYIVYSTISKVHGILVEWSKGWFSTCILVHKNLIWWVEREQKFWLPFGTAKLTKSLKFTTEII